VQRSCRPWDCYGSRRRRPPAPSSCPTISTAPAAAPAGRGRAAGVPVSASSAARPTSRRPPRSTPSPPRPTPSARWIPQRRAASTARRRSGWDSSRASAAPSRTRPSRGSASTRGPPRPSSWAQPSPGPPGGWSGRASRDRRAPRGSPQTPRGCPWSISSTSGPARSTSTSMGRSASRTPTCRAAAGTRCGSSTTGRRRSSPISSASPRA
jgi:hypothetical protein